MVVTAICRQGENEMVELNYNEIQNEVRDHQVEPNEVSSQNEPSGTDLRAAMTTDSSSKHLPELNVGIFSSDDGPVTRTESTLTGERTVRVPAELGNPHHTIELIESGQFQNANGSITPAGLESIRAAIQNCPFYQGFDGRTSDVQNHINRHLGLGSGRIQLQYDRDPANANTLQGSQPFINATIGNRTVRIPMMDGYARLYKP
jgi:hypothetical protein